MPLIPIEPFTLFVLAIMFVALVAGVMVSSMLFNAVDSMAKKHDNFLLDLKVLRTMVEVLDENQKKISKQIDKQKDLDDGWEEAGTGDSYFITAVDVGRHIKCDDSGRKWHRTIKRGTEPPRTHPPLP